MLHRSKKANKFFVFIATFSNLVVNYSPCIRGIKVQVKGRFRRAPRSKIRTMQYGVLPLQTVDSSVSYTFLPVNTTYGTFGVKV